MDDEDKYISINYLKNEKFKFEVIESINETSYKIKAICSLNSNEIEKYFDYVSKKYDNKQLEYMIEETRKIANTTRSNDTKEKLLHISDALTKLESEQKTSTSRRSR